jgi:hypothetical protein
VLEALPGCHAPGRVELLGGGWILGALLWCSAVQAAALDPAAGSGHSLALKLMRDAVLSLGVAQWSSFSNGSPSMPIVGTADFNNDDRTGIVLRNTPLMRVLVHGTPDD